MKTTDDAISTGECDEPTSPRDKKITSKKSQIELNAETPLSSTGGAISNLTTPLSAFLSPKSTVKIPTIASTIASIIYNVMTYINKNKDNSRPAASSIEAISVEIRNVVDLNTAEHVCLLWNASSQFKNSSGNGEYAYVLAAAMIIDLALLGIVKVHHLSDRASTLDRLYISRNQYVQSSGFFYLDQIVNRIDPHVAHDHDLNNSNVSTSSSNLVSNSNQDLSNMITQPLDLYIYQLVHPKRPGSMSASSSSAAGGGSFLINHNSVMGKLQEKGICEQTMTLEKHSTAVLHWKLAKEEAVDNLFLSLRRIIWRKQVNVNDHNFNAFLYLVTAVKSTLEFDESLVATFDEKSERRDAWETLEQLLLPN